MDHVYFSDGNQKRISWVIQNEETNVVQHRDHAENYLDRVSVEQSKYIALHVGIFWCIGRFIIKNGDTVKIMLDSKSILDHLSNNTISTDSFIETRTRFIKQLMEQRKLVIKYELIKPEQNIATKALSL
ncbi:MAG TPA: hypothetical protein VLA53_03525 [Nitrosopumilaceae archaeon]|nr:hypothetical protein [Nitrosopumilaceae archaeon]